MLKEYEVVKKYMQDNGIEFSGEPKWVDVECKSFDRQLYIQFWDGGIIVRVNDFVSGYEDGEWVSMANERVFNANEVIELIKKHAN